MVLPPGVLSVVFVIFVDSVDVYFLYIGSQVPGFLSHTTPGIGHGRSTGEVVASTTKMQLGPPHAGFAPSPPSVHTH